MSNDRQIGLDVDTILVMKEDIGALKSSVDSIRDTVDKMWDLHNKNSETLQKNTADIAYHIKRTDTLEKALDIKVSAVEADIKPIKKHVDTVGLIFKAIAWTVGAAASIFGAWEAAKNIFGH